MWVDENFVIDEVTANKFYNQVEVPQIILNYGKYVILVVGAVMIFGSILFYKTNKKSVEYHRGDYQPINNSQEDKENEPTESSNLID